jgi:hypothetical protein
VNIGNEVGDDTVTAAQFITGYSVGMPGNGDPEMILTILHVT